MTFPTLYRFSVRITRRAADFSSANFYQPGVKVTQPGLAPHAKSLIGNTGRAMPSLTYDEMDKLTHLPGLSLAALLV